MPSPRATYTETYRSPGLRIKEECLPTLPSAAHFSVERAYVLKAGRAIHDGLELEFQDIRIYLRGERRETDASQ
jgi:hypothetical protein